MLQWTPKLRPQFTIRDTFQPIERFECCWSGEVTRQPNTSVERLRTLRVKKVSEPHVPPLPTMPSFSNTTLVRSATDRVVPSDPHVSPVFGLTRDRAHM